MTSQYSDTLDDYFMIMRDKYFDELIDEDTYRLILLKLSEWTDVAEERGLL